MDCAKKRAAVASAVLAYIKTEEEVACLMPLTAAAPAQPVMYPPPPPLNLWGISGRQAAMSMRNMMQLKAYHRLKR